MRPGICFDACPLTSTLKNPVTANIIKAPRVLRRITENSLVIDFLNLCELHQLQFYSDANLSFGNSAGGQVIFHVDQNKKNESIVMENKSPWSFCL